VNANHPSPTLPDCLCLTGPTTSGKTAIALQIAQALQAAHRPVEIISVDSALVYRGMDIGTAKPSALERRLTVHHLIDTMDPSQTYSAAQFVQDAHTLITAIRARGHTPLLVGGTMLYFKALFEGLDAMPAADRTVRAQLAAQCERDGLPALYRELQQLDPITAQRLAPADQQRIMRALEVYRVSGQPISALHSAKPASTPPTMIALEPQDRAWLHQRIATRFMQMLEQGLVDEVERLESRGDLHAELPSMRCVGYRQTWQCLVEGDLSPLAERGIAATRQLAKRQLTWLRSMPSRQVVQADAPDASDQAIHMALRWAQITGAEQP
jgi:tRNA dimethylallyltransferase